MAGVLAEPMAGVLVARLVESKALSKGFVTAFARVVRLECEQAGSRVDSMVVWRAGKKDESTAESMAAKMDHPSEKQMVAWMENEMVGL